MCTVAGKDVKRVLCIHHFGLFAPRGCMHDAVCIPTLGFKAIDLNCLAQGYWPDGVYTAPSDAALQSDILAAQAAGYNLLRKHVKVEPARWYWHCDRLGMLVWQVTLCLCALTCDGQMRLYCAVVPVVCSQPDGF